MAGPDSVFPSWNENVAKPGVRTGTSHKGHKRHKNFVLLVLFVARSPHIRGFCNTLGTGGEYTTRTCYSRNNLITNFRLRTLASAKGSIEQIVDGLRSIRFKNASSGTRDHVVSDRGC